MATNHRPWPPGESVQNQDEDQEMQPIRPGDRSKYLQRVHANPSGSDDDPDNDTKDDPVPQPDDATVTVIVEITTASASDSDSDSDGSPPPSPTGLDYGGFREYTTTRSPPIPASAVDATLQSSPTSSGVIQPSGGGGLQPDEPDNIPARIIVTGVATPVIMLIVIGLSIWCCVFRRRNKRRSRANLEAATSTPPMQLASGAQSVTRFGGTPTLPGSSHQTTPPTALPAPPPPVLLNRDLAAAYYTGIDTSDSDSVHPPSHPPSHPHPPPGTTLQNPFESLDDEEPPPPYRPRSELGLGLDLPTPGLGDPFADPYPDSPVSALGVGDDADASAVSNGMGFRPDHAGAAGARGREDADASMVVNGMGFWDGTNGSRELVTSDAASELSELSDDSGDRRSLPARAL